MRIRSALAVVSTIAVLGAVGIAHAGPHPAAGHEEHGKPGKADEPGAVEEKVAKAGKAEAEKAKNPGEKDKTDDEKAKAGKGDPGQDDEDEGERGRPWVKLAKKQERLDALKAKLEEKEKSFEMRLQAARSRALSHWGPLALNMEVQKELREHAERLARLRRIRDLAEVEGDAALVKRAEAALKKEHDRHEKEETRLRGSSGGAANAAPSAEAHAAPGSAVNPAPKGGAQ